MKRLVGSPASGFLPRPPIGRQEACGILGAEITQETWGAIDRAFSDCGVRLNSLASLPIDNQNRNDPRSYRKGREAAERKLERAIALIREVSDDQELCRAASEICSMRRDGIPLRSGVGDELHKAVMALVSARAQLRCAPEPIFSLEDSEASARRDLARNVVRILTASGFAAKLTGWAEADSETGLAESDMTPTEQLISAMGIHDAATPSAFARWLRDAIGGN